MPKVTEAYKEKKRGVILEGALDCFASKGYQGTTIDDIAQELGISKGAIYTYFTSKEDIYIQLMEKRMNQMVKSFHKSFAHLPSASAKLKYAFQRFIEQPLEDLRRLVRFHLEFTIHSSRNEEMQALMDRNFQKAIDLIAEIIAEGKQVGEFRKEVDEQTVTSLFWATRDGIALQYLSSGEKEQFTGLIKGMEEMLFRYLV
jgi:AcrR family transcriptional regulator